MYDTLHDMFCLSFGLRCSLVEAEEEEVVVEVVAVVVAAEEVLLEELELRALTPSYSFSRKMTEELEPSEIITPKRKQWMVSEMF